MQGLPAVTAGLFRFLDEENVDYCVLGDARGLPDAGPDTLELVVDKISRRILALLLKNFCDRNQLHFIDKTPLPEGVESYLLSWIGRNRRPEFLRLCVRTDYLRFGRRLWTARDLLKRRVQAADAPERCTIYLAPAAKEFARCLLLCIDRNELSQRDAEHLSRQWRLDPEGAALQVARFWDASREGGVIVRAAVSDHWEPVRASRNALYSALTFHNVPSPVSWPYDLHRRWRAWTQPQGMLIACLGPQAAGKRDVIERLAANPLAPFTRAQMMQLRPHVMRPRRAEQGDESVKRKPRGRLGTIAKLMMFAADYWLGYWLRIRPSLVRCTLIASDSYFDDVLVDPRRYRMSRPRAFARLLAPWIPQPALWLVFDVPADVLRARQDDGSMEDLERQRGEYRRVLRGRRNVVVLDASQSADDVIADVERAIVAQLARRAARRLGLPLDSVDNPWPTRLLLFLSRRNIPVLSRLVRIVFNSDLQCRIPSDIHMPHPYGVVIQAQAALGRRVTVMQQVTIGSKDPTEATAPIIGDDVYIGAGARVLGDVRIGDRVVIGANAVVTRDVPAGSTVVGANRIIAGRLALATKRAADGSVARFPLGARRLRH
jgi:serine acetyltransferase/thymidylate kinase